MEDNTTLCISKPYSKVCPIFQLIVLLVQIVLENWKILPNTFKRFHCK